MAPPDETTPLPADRALSPLVLLRRLDKQDAMLEVLIQDKEEAKTSKAAERFMILEHDFKVMKRLAWAMLLAFVIVVVDSISSRFSLRITDAPSASETAARLFLDRINKPDAVTPLTKP